MKKIMIAVAAASLTLASCFDLDKQPEGVLSTSEPFTSTGEMRNYLDMFYQSSAGCLRLQGFDAGGGQYIAGYDTHSDNMASNSVSTRLAGQSSLSNASRLTAYTQIRNLNFMLCNLGYSQEIGTADFNHYVGEAYYFRAWLYYQMLKDYGPVTWVNKPLDPNIEELQLPRDSRTLICDSILSDLDRAASLMYQRSNSSTMRVHSDVALALKSEVALFEATWEKYHKGTDFADASCTDAKIQDYLQQAVTAAQDVIDRGVWSISTKGGVTEAYRLVFETSDLSNNAEVLWFKMYDGDQIGNNVDRYLNQGGGGVGITASLIDDYLTIDGHPYVGDEKLAGKRIYGDELQPTVRDPRLAQTIAVPGQQLRPDEGAYVVPPLIGTSSYNQNMTGYSLLKHVQINYEGSLDAEYKGATPGIQFRYADVLLNLAEALAEQGGAGNAERIQSALQPLRDRVGMPGVDFDREYNTDSSYPFRDLDKYIQCVRRERRIEQACEGRRLDDILRWAAADVLIVGKWPQGALFVGSNLENHSDYGGNLVYDQSEGNNLFLSGSAGDELRYILPINPSGYESGWQFRLDRDYLKPIHQDMISLTNGQWTQNPGW